MRSVCAVAGCWAAVVRSVEARLAVHLAEDHEGGTVAELEVVLARTGGADVYGDVGHPLAERDALVLVQ